MLNKDRIGALAILAFAVGYGALTFNIHLLPFQANSAFTARTMPFFLTLFANLFRSSASSVAMAFAIGLSLAILLRPSDLSMPDVKGFQWKRGLLVCIVMLAYGFLVRPLGFITATTLFLMAGYLILGERRPVILIAASLPIVVAFWALMTQVLDVFIEPFPSFLAG
ncbi:MAG: tripartite tricarboxylate transporter TctB family protein [Rhodospirillaceae bacterium]